MPGGAFAAMVGYMGVDRTYDLSAAKRQIRIKFQPRPDTSTGRRQPK